MIDINEPVVFEWDEWNAFKNWIKHKVATKEAEEVFTDTKKVIFSDIEHSSKEEDRYVVIARTKKGRLLFTVFTIRGEKVRIISTRDANRKEVAVYEKKAHLTKV